MGQSTGRSKAKTKAFLDNVEKRIDGDKEGKGEGTRRHEVHGKKRGSKKSDARK